MCNNRFYATVGVEKQRKALGARGRRKSPLRDDMQGESTAAVSITTSIYDRWMWPSVGNRIYLHITARLTRASLICTPSVAGVSLNTP